MKGFSEGLLSLLSFQGPHTSGNLESRNKIKSFSNKQTGSRIHVRDDNYNGNNRSRIKTLRDDSLTTSGHTVSTGFTLIELLVVILIIGIVAAAAMPSYRVAVGSSRAATMYNLVRAVDLAQQHFYMQTNRYASNLDALIIAMPAGFKKESPSKISSTDVSCNISGWGGAKTAFLCEDIKDLVLIEKYHRDTFFICWADIDSSVSNKICQNLSGRDTPTSQGDSIGAWAHRQSYFMNK